MNFYGSKQLADSMRTVRKNTILIAEDIPEASCSYRPTPESRSVAETLLHIAGLTKIDQRIHEQERLVSLEGVSFSTLAKGLIDVPRAKSSLCCAQKEIAGANGFSRFPSPCSRSRCVCQRVRIPA